MPVILTKIHFTLQKEHEMIFHIEITFKLSSNHVNLITVKTTKHFKIFYFIKVQALFITFVLHIFFAIILLRCQILKIEPPRMAKT